MSRGNDNSFSAPPVHPFSDFASGECIYYEREFQHVKRRAENIFSKFSNYVGWMSKWYQSRYTRNTWKVHKGELTDGFLYVQILLYGVSIFSTMPLNLVSLMYHVLLWSFGRVPQEETHLPQ